MIFFDIKSACGSITEKIRISAKEDVGSYDYNNKSRRVLKIIRSEEGG
jgi:hypothetical protein